jgi:hypothetical protein
VRAWPPPLAWELLRETEDDLVGHSFLDIDVLLKHWGVVQNLPGPERLEGYRTLVHPDLPSFVFRYPLRTELAPATVRYICGAIRQLHRSLTNG